MKIQLHVTIQVIKVKPVFELWKGLDSVNEVLCKNKWLIFLFFGSKKVAKMAIIKWSYQRWAGFALFHCHCALDSKNLNFGNPLFLKGGGAG